MTKYRLLPTASQLKRSFDDNKSLIAVDTEKYPDARALDMDLTKGSATNLFSSKKNMHELIIVIQAIVVQGDTVVGYRFPNGGNGSDWINHVTFLSDDEVANMGSQPFFYSKSVLNTTAKDIWAAAGKDRLL